MRVSFLIFIAGAVSSSTWANAEEPLFDTVVMDDGSSVYQMRGQVTGAGEISPSAVEIVWLNWRGEEKILSCDSNGRFQSLLDDQFGWISGVYARRGAEISPFLALGLRPTLLRPHLPLGPPARLSGVALLEDGTPVEDASIRLNPFGHRGIAVATVATQADGRYHFAALPPGNFGISLSHPAVYWDGITKRGDQPPITLTAGEVKIHNFETKPRFPVNGRLINREGNPIPDHTFTLDDGPYYILPATATSDTEGRFTVSVIPAEKERTFSISHPEYGMGKLIVPPFGEVENVESTLEARFRGRARIHGRVVGPSGEPVALAQIGRELTDVSGTFDMGWLSLDENDEIGLGCFPPPWHDQWSSLRTAPLQNPGDVMKRYYRPLRTKISVTPGEDAPRDVVLEAIPTRTIHGITLDGNGQPTPGVLVAVYEGRAFSHNWLPDLAPYHAPEPEPSPWMPRQTLNGGGEFSHLLARVRSGADGRWEALVPVGVLEKSWLVGQPSPFENVRTVAAADESLQQVAFCTSEIHEVTDEVALNLAPIPSDLVMEALITDQSGAPMPDVAWYINKINGPFTTDARGHLRIPRFESRIELQPADESFTIAQALADGVVEAAPTPRFDEQTEESGLAFFGAWKPRDAEEAFPHFFRTDASVSFDFFDTQKGTLTITLAR